MNMVVITFQSTHHAIGAQHILEQHHIAFKVIPTPAEISADCGIALLLTQEVADIGKQILCAKEIPAHFTSAISKERGLVVTGPFID